MDEQNERPLAAADVEKRFGDEAPVEALDPAPAAPKKKAGGIKRARTIVILVVFLSVVAGLLLRAGWGTLCSLGIDAAAFVCPLGALETLLAGREFIPRLVVALLCVLIVAALIGRFFCSWICVVPPLSRFFHPDKGKKDAVAETSGARADASGEGEPDAAGRDEAADAAAKADAPSLSTAHACSACGGCPSHRADGPLPPIGGKRDGLRFDTRHGVLLGALVSSAVCGFPVFCLVCPIGLTLALVIAVYTAIFEQNPTISILIFAAIILVELVFFRKWCRKICPVGALLSLVGAKAPLMKPRVDKAKCLREKGIDCRVCVQVCPEELDPHAKSIPECTRCGKCVDDCPAHAISFRKHRSLPTGAEKP